MRMRIVLALAMVALAGVGLALGPIQGQPGPRVEPEPPHLLQEGIQVEARGPVHEAFAAPVVRDAQPGPVIPKQPPQSIEELPPETKPQGAIWIPGYWAWDEEREEFLWVSGLWRLPPPERTWATGYWREVQGGWQRISGYWAVMSQQVVEAWPEPPEPIPEAAPPAPYADGIYAPGCWVFVQTRYLWRPGFWVQPRPGWVYVYPSYVWTPAGCVFIDGHWDYDFHHCGVLFAPVRIDPRVIRPGFVYRPHYCVPVDFFVRALFVRPHGRHYYFGDFYDARYARAGYRPWVDYRVAGRFHDPYFTHYRWENRRDPRWDENLRAVYVARREDSRARPPQTLVQQQKTDVKVVVPIKQIAAAQQNVKFENVTKVQMRELQQTANQLRAFAVKRGTVEGQGKSALAATKGGGTPVKIDLPAPKLAAKPPDTIKPPPPAPALPKPAAQPIPKSKPAEKPPKLEPPAKPPKVEPKPPPKGKPDGKPPKTEPPPKLPKVEPAPKPPKDKAEPAEKPKPPPPKKDDKKPKDEKKPPPDDPDNLSAYLPIRHLVLEKVPSPRASLRALGLGSRLA